MPRPSTSQQELVIRRAQGRCEYFQFPDSAAELPFHIDHIIAEKHGGTTEDAILRGVLFLQYA